MKDKKTKSEHKIFKAKTLSKIGMVLGTIFMCVASALKIAGVTQLRASEIITLAIGYTLVWSPTAISIYIDKITGGDNAHYGEIEETPYNEI